MLRNQVKISASGVAVLLLVLLNAIVLKMGYTVNKEWYALLLATIPLLLISLLLFYRKVL